MAAKSRQPDPVETARGIARSQKAELPVVRLALPGIPAQCPHCHMPVAFPLAAHAGRIQAVCPACHLAVAVVAVTSPEPPAPGLLCKCSARPEGATGIRWTGTNLTQCFAIIDYDECGEEPAPGVLVTDPALTGDADDCACDTHAKWREPV